MSDPARQLRIAALLARAAARFTRDEAWFPGIVGAHPVRAAIAPATGVYAPRRVACAPESPLARVWTLEGVLAAAAEGDANAEAGAIGLLLTVLRAYGLPRGVGLDAWAAPRGVTSVRLLLATARDLLPRNRFSD